MDECEVLDGFTVDDYIAFPGNLLEEGMNCAINDGTQSNSAPETYEEMPGDMSGEVFEGAIIPEEGIVIEEGVLPGEGMIMEDGVLPEEGIEVEMEAAP